MPEEEDRERRRVDAQLREQGRLVEADAQTRRVLSGILRFKPDDEDAWSDLADMFARHRDRGRFWEELRDKSFHGVVVALLTSAALWLFNRYAGRL